MKAALKTLLCLAVVFTAVVIVRGEDKKKEEKKTLKGTFACGKCVFKLDKSITKGKCCNAIEVKEGDKEVIYILQDKGGGEKYHKGEGLCTGKKKGSVTGVVSKKGDQLYIKPEKDGVKFED